MNSIYTKKIIALGADHAGWVLKNEIKDELRKRGYETIDVGTNSPDSVDYPVIADKLCSEITSGNATLGILVCGTGIGMSMAANKHSGIRAALCSDTFSAKMTRQHNDANVLCLGARVVASGLALDIVREFTESEFEGGRHSRRVEMLDSLDDNKAVQEVQNNKEKKQSDDSYKKVTVVIPSLDPDTKLLDVVREIGAIGFEDILIVDDGSKPVNKHYFEEAAALMPGKVTLLKHGVNKGKGAAIKKALCWYMQNRPEGLGVITVDGDNQHRASDAKACAELMLETGDLVLGVRDFSGPDVPKRSRVGNKTASMMLRIFGGVKISDTQTGLRAFPNSAIPALSSARGDRFEYETNMLMILKPNKIGLSEQVIETVYIEENKSSHYRPLKDSWRIFKVVMRNFGLYSLDSLISSATDNILYLFFMLLASYINEITAPNVAAFIPARIISSIVNYSLNKKVAFTSHEKNKKALWKYFTLVVIQVAVAMVAVPSIANWLDVRDDSFLNVLIKMAVETVMFFAMYNVQRTWVFHAGRDDPQDKSTR